MEIPPRPRELSLDGVDPCTLFTEAQRAELGVDDYRSGASTEGHFEGMLDCMLDVAGGPPFYGYSAMAVTFEGIEPWLTPDERNIDPAELITIGGYPAAEFKFKGSTDMNCVVAVDVADDQYLWVEMDAGVKGTFPQEQICQASERSAEMAVATLQTLK